MSGHIRLLYFIREEGLDSFKKKEVSYSSINNDIGTNLIWRTAYIISKIYLPLD
jgi:hypothetical protein